MGFKLTKKELHNVSGGGCGETNHGKCDRCGTELKGKYWTCKFSADPRDHSSYSKYKFCDECAKKPGHQGNPCYWDWEKHEDE